MTVSLEARGFDPTPVEEEEKKDDEHKHLSAEERLAMAAANLATRPKADDVEHTEEDAFRNEAAEFGTPESQSLLWPGVLAALSIDRIDYSAVPSGAIVYRMASIRNIVGLNQPAQVEFEWDREHPLVASGAMKVYPASGKIDPGGIVVCKFTFRPGFDPEVIDTILSCRIVTLVETEAGGRRGRRNRRGSTAASRRSGVNGGGSVASTVHSAQSRGGTANSHVSVVRRTTAASRGGKPLAMVPGRSVAESISGSRATAGGQSRGGGRLGTAGSMSSQMTGRGAGPDQGPTQLLFAHIRAEVMRPDVYRHTFRHEKNSMAKFFIPQREFKRPDTADIEDKLRFGVKPGGDPEDPAAVAAADKRDIVKALTGDIMAHLVEDLIDDPFVSEIIDEMPPPKIPYFVQLRDLDNPETQHVLGELPQWESEEQKAAAEKALAEKRAERKEAAALLEKLSNSPAAAAAADASGLSQADEGKKEEVKKEEGPKMIGGISAEDYEKIVTNPEAQGLIARIMENTFFNIISEVAHGEINLEVEPRKMVIPQVSFADSDDAATAAEGQ